MTLIKLLVRDDIKIFIDTEEVPLSTDAVSMTVVGDEDDEGDDVGFAVPMCATPNVGVTKRCGPTFDLVTDFVTDYALAPSGSDAR